MRLELPFPPPVDLQYGRNFALWRDLALWQLAQQIGPASPCSDWESLALDIALAHPPDNKPALLMLAPALEELLVAGGLIPDRRAIQAIRVRWAEAERPARGLLVLATKDVRRHLDPRRCSETGSRGATS